MRRLLLGIVVVFLLSASAFARVVPIYSYEALFKKADVVAIVKVTKIEDTTARLEGASDPSLYQGKLANATVGLMLKGEARKTLSFQFFNYLPAKLKNVYLLDGAHFPDLSKAKSIHYLVFLKKTADGGLILATGHFDAAQSIAEVVPQSPDINVAPAK